MNRILQRSLCGRWLPLVLVLLALAATSSAVTTGWQQDDLIHRYFLLGYTDYAGQSPSPLDLFYFLDGDSVRATSLMDLGVVPWWTLPDLRLSFLRPLSSATHWMDYQLWPHSGVLMHLHSLLWLGAVVLAATAVYRGLMGPTWVAGLAALFFALDDAHGLPAGWLANRNALLALFFGLLTLLVHDRWRRGGWKPGAYLGPLMLLLGLLSGESALAVLAYVCAYAVVLDTGAPRQRVVSLSSYAAVALGWLILYRSLGYGASGSGFYVDPISEPLEYLKAILWKAPLLLADQWGVPPSSFVAFLEQDAIVPLWFWALLVLTAVGLVLFPLVRQDRVSRYWLLGMLLSLPLACTTIPHSRLLSFVGIGAMGLLAQWVAGMLTRAEWLPSRRSWRMVARPMLVFLLAVHIVLAPLLLAMNARSATFAEPYIQKPMESISLGSAVEEQDLVILNHPLVFFAHYFLTVRVLAGQSVPRSVRVLAPGEGALIVRRPDARTLRLGSANGFLHSPFDRVFRGLDHPLAVGEKVALDRMSVTILELTEDGRPAEASFGFEVPLEDSSLNWLRWDRGSFVPCRPPAIGDSLVLSGSPIDLFSSSQ